MVLSPVTIILSHSWLSSIQCPHQSPSTGFKEGQGKMVTMHIDIYVLMASTEASAILLSIPRLPSLGMDTKESTLRRSFPPI